MTTIGNTIIGRSIVKSAPSVALYIPDNAPAGLYEVTLWSSDWFNREGGRDNLPVYFEFVKERCSAGYAPMLPMDSTLYRLRMVPGTRLWVCGESDTILNYTVNKVA